jgi:tight adherence protein B
MNGLVWALAAVLLVGAAVVAAWPARAALRRLQGRPKARADLDVRRLRTQVGAYATRSPRRAAGAAVLTGAAAGLMVAGPVAGLVLAIYVALGARAVIRRTRRRRALAARSRSLDNLNALAADLRAGLPVASDPMAAGPAASDPTASDAAASDATASCSVDEPSDPRLAELTAAVWRLAEQTGAPAADLVERIEADARAGDRARATAAAQAAGAQATALLLAGLPVGGIALGYGIGVDPLQVLLETPVGGVCLIAAAALQSAGLLWADRLSTGATR